MSRRHSVFEKESQKEETPPKSLVKNVMDNSIHKVKTWNFQLPIEYFNAVAQLCVFACGQVNVRLRGKTLFVRPVSSVEKAHRSCVTLSQKLLSHHNYGYKIIYIQILRNLPWWALRFCMYFSFKTAEMWNVCRFMLQLECYKNPSMLSLLQADINIKLDVIQEPWITQQDLTQQRERGSSNGVLVLQYKLWGPQGNLNGVFFCLPSGDNVQML